MTKIRLRYVNEFIGRHGKVYRYVRIPGRRKVPLPGLPGSVEFMDAYAAAISGAPLVEIGAKRTKPGTFSALLVCYYQNQAFTSLSPVTQRARRNILENFRKEHGDKRVAHLLRGHVETMVAKKKPFAQRVFIKALRGLMEFAMKGESPLRRDDPTLRIQLVPVHSEGHATWSEEQIGVYEAKHPIGTKARLAMALMLYTGCRRGDVVVLGRQHIRDGWLTYTQDKNRVRKPVTVSIPVHPELRRIIDTTPNEHLTFLTTQYGKPFTAAGFGGWMRDRCDEAGLPSLSSHGLRKAIARRMAEAHKTPHEIMSVTGHKTIAEVERYTKAVSQKKLAASAMDFDMPNVLNEMRTGSDKPQC